MSPAAAVRMRRDLGLPIDAARLRGMEAAEMTEDTDCYYVNGAGCVWLVNVAGECHHSVMCGCSFWTRQDGQG